MQARGMKWETQEWSPYGPCVEVYSGSWCQYRVQARDEVGGRAGVLHRLRGIPNVRRGQGWGKR